MAWFNESQGADLIAISSRVRFARNLKGFPFPHKLDAKGRSEALARCREAQKGSAELSSKLSFLPMAEIPEQERQALLEKHLISPDMLKNPERRAVMLSKGEDISVMLGEEDHIRIQAVCPGFSLTEAYHLAESVDKELEKGADYAFSDRFGYLTCCPTNLGTGMRASVMLHLPALTDTGKINELLSAASRAGIAVRGLYGEGSGAGGNLYQISNQTTLGLSEQETLQKLTMVIRGIIEQEMAVRKVFLNNDPSSLEDRVWRSFGILTNCRKISFSELLSLLSDLRLGATLGVIDLAPERLNRLMVAAAPAHIMKRDGQVATEVQRDIARARLVRELLS